MVFRKVELEPRSRKSAFVLKLDALLRQCFPIDSLDDNQKLFFRVADAGIGAEQGKTEGGQGKEVSKAEAEGAREVRVEQVVESFDDLLVVFLVQVILQSVRIIVFAVALSYPTNKGLTRRCHYNARV